MESIGAEKAKTHLPELLDRVAQGQRITITRRGVPVAMLVPTESAGDRPVSDVIRDIRKARKGVKLGGISVRVLIEEGRR